jgi:hypothetical protein
MSAKKASVPPVLISSTSAAKYARSVRRASDMLKTAKRRSSWDAGQTQSSVDDVVIDIIDGVGRVAAMIAD